MLSIAMKIEKARFKEPKGFTVFSGIVQFHIQKLLIEIQFQTIKFFFDVKSSDC